MLHRSRWLSASALRSTLVALALVQLAACSTPEERATQYLASGQELLAKGDAVKAGIEFRNALKNKKDLVGAWRGLAQIDEQNKNWAGLGPSLRAIVEYDPSDVEARLKLVRLMLLGGAYQEALPIISTLSDGENPPAAAVALKATILLAFKDNEGALKEAHRALAIEPDNLDALTIVAMDKLARGEAKLALDLLAKGKVNREMEIPARVMTIAILEKLGDQTRIEAELRKLVELDPKTFRRELVRYYTSRGRDLDAEQELRSTAAADPSNISAVLDLVRFLHARKGPDAAQRELEDRIKAGGDVFPFQLALAEYQFARGQHGTAIPALQKLIAASTAPEQKVKAQLSLASMHIQQRSWSAAEPIIADVLKTDERNTDALRFRAVVRLEQGQAEGAANDLREALTEQPQSAPLLQLLAVALERTGAIELAEKHYGDAMRASEFNPNFGLQYVSFLQRRSSPQRVEQVLTELADRNPNSIPVWTALGQARLQVRDWAGAQAVADNIKRLGDGRGVADQIRGQALAGQNNLNGSIQALHSAFEAAPGSVQPMATLVRAYLQAGKPDEAETFLKGILSANASSPEALVLMASVQSAKNAPQQALTNLQAAIERNPKNSLGYSALAEFHLRRNELDQSLTAVRNGLKEQPNQFGLRLTLASILEAKKDFEGAIREYEAMLAQEPNSLVAANNLASLISEHRTDKESLDRAQALAGMLRKSNIPQFKDTVGWLAYLSGDARTAVSLLEEAVEALPRNAQVRYHLGMSYIKAGQTEKGQEQLKQADELEAAAGPLKEKIRLALKAS